MSSSWQYAIIRKYPQITSWSRLRWALAAITVVAAVSARCCSSTSMSSSWQYAAITNYPPITGWSRLRWAAAAIAVAAAVLAVVLGLS